MKWAHTLGVGLWLAASAVAQEPELPPGLGQPPAAQEPRRPTPQQPAAPDEPALPTGLESGPAAEGPRAEPSARSERAWARPKGFVDLRAGARTQSDPLQRDQSLAEARLRLEFEHAFDRGVLRFKPDLVADVLESSQSVDLERGRGFLDLREGSFATSPLPFLDLKVGRQVLTWGTGDLLFLNDLFPKDWVSFFVGRDEEYLKAPSDALKVGMFGAGLNFEVVYTPRFDPDRFVRSERLSFFDPLAGRVIGRDVAFAPEVPDRWFRDDEFAARLSGNFGGHELAAYGYWGRWKSPGGFDGVSQRPVFPRLGVYGASARTQFAGGIANLEVGYYDSRQDPGGADPLVENSQGRFLAGFERDLPQLAAHLTVGAQYYLEAMLDHAEFRRTLPTGVPERDELRHVLTLRVTKELLEQRLRVSVFTYASPSDRDWYLRGTVSYAIDDAWSVFGGVNWFGGRRDFTFFGQFEDNSNVYLGARLAF